ncbi:MAG: 2-isopropylmalate synthase [Methanosarcinales archaeon]|nr:2-isopropylmalate synthase [Methanosarcinales archaeon]
MSMNYRNEELRDKFVRIFDTTLRDGEQTPGVSLDTQQKLIIAEQLDKLGVDIIEAGFPIASPGEKDAVARIAKLGLNSQVCGLSRVITKDIDACLDCDVDMVHIFVSTSDIQRIHTIGKSQEEVVELAVSAVQHIKDHGVACMFSAMDATRTDIDYLTQIYQAVEKAGCDIINVPDTVGVMVPSMMYRLIRDIAKTVSVPLDTHCHNDYGLAVANSTAAIEAGASQVQVTINGLGERAGNADLAETVMILHTIYGAKTNIETEHLYETSRIVEQHTGVRIPQLMPIVGENAFAHESGIHTHGVLVRTDTFEPGVMTPEMVGQKRRIVLGKHAGRHAVKLAIEAAGFQTTDEQLVEILNRIKELGDKGKPVTDADLYAITETILGEVSKKEQFIDLKEVSVMTGNTITPTAAVKACVGGEIKVVANTGVGPVDAALGAVQNLLGEGTKVHLQDFKLEAISGGSDALAEVTIAVEDASGRIVNARAAREDIVMASVEALVNAINRLIMVRGKT